MKEQSILYAMFKAATLGIIVVDAAGKILHANPSAQKLFAYTEDELIGQNVDILVPDSYRGGHQTHREVYHKNPSPRLMGQGRDLCGRRKDGVEFPVEISLSSGEVEGEQYVVTFISDISERKKAEEDLRRERNMAQTYLDMAGSIIIIVETDGTVQTVNKEGLKILNVTEEGIIGKNWFDEFVPEQSRQQVRDVFNNLMHRKVENVEHYENEIISKSGETHLIKWYNRLLLNDVGEPIATISSGVDITKERAIENKLNNYAIELERQVKNRTKELQVSEQKLIKSLDEERKLSELKSRFVSMASHEFRTPLSTILSSAGLIGRYEKEEQQGKRDKHIKRIKASVKNLTAILNDFLSLEKLESNKVRYEPSTIDLNEFLEDFLEEINFLLKPNQTIKLHQNGISNIETDVHLLRNILNNLLSNAIKYSTEGSEVILRLELVDRMLTINVKDQGIGIPKEDQENMFSRFFRANNVTDIQGTGLGLTIVKRYLSLMQGTISFVSEPNKGTTFTVTIPQ